MIWVPISQSSRGSTAVTLPCVPTDIKTGVSTTPCGVVNRPRRALELAWVLSSSNMAARVHYLPRWFNWIRAGCAHSRGELWKDDSDEGLSHNHRHGFWPDHSGTYLPSLRGRPALGEGPHIYSPHACCHRSLYLGVAFAWTLIARVLLD